MVKVMDDVSWSLSDRHATKATALRKTIAIRKTAHIAEAVSMRLGDAILGCFRCIREKVTLVEGPGFAFLSPN